jgi:alanine or glycine:cation symporter, AGCS family
MEEMFAPAVEAAAKAVDAANAWVWSPFTIALLFGTGIFLTLRYRFVQVTRLGDAFRNFRGGGAAADKSGGISPFQAFMTGLAASVGTGNIAGVATAIAAGGPGAVFWIWAYGFFATVIKLTEAMLAVRFRSKSSEGLAAGPMFYLEQGLGLRWLGLVYAAVAGIAALTTTPFTQPNSIAVVFESELGVPRWVCGVALAVFTWVVVIGGAKKVAAASERLAPAMVGLYLAGGLVVIVACAGQLPTVLSTIFQQAFSLEAAGGGAAGTVMMVAVRYGLARGIYANEAGYGTAAVAYGSAASDRPAVQGMNAVLEVYIVSFVTSTISALTILVSGVTAGGATSTSLVAQAFASVIPGGGFLVLLCALLFGYTTLIGWGYYGEQFLAYLMGQWVVLPYRWIYCALILPGALTKVELVWAWGDLMNGLQIFPNLAGVLLLSGLVAKMLRDDPARGG